MNISDAERVASVLNTHGFRATSDEREADIIVALACSVREKAVHKILGKGNQWKKMKPRPKTVLTGCVLEQDKKKLEEKFDLVFDLNNTDVLEEFLNESIHPNNPNSPKSLKNPKTTVDSRSYLNIQPNYISKISAYLPIMTGCDNFCSYCAVPYTRGREISRPGKDVLEEVESLVKSGYKEITLLGQNVNSYNSIKYKVLSIKENKKNHDTLYLIHNTKNKLNKNKTSNQFVRLLEKIDTIPGDHWIRFYANHPKDFNDELIDFLKKSKHFCHYIHLPLQSGDDEVLKKMNRHYSAKQYLEIIKKIKKEIPDCAITTDIIVGFPGETDKQFQNTVKLLEKVSFDMIFISEYSPRTGTVAANMEDNVSHEEKGKRKKYLNDEVLAKSVLANNKKLVGRRVRVLVYKKDKKGFFVGKTEGLKDIRIFVEARFIAPKIGEFVNIKITKANSWGMEGEIG